ncbi:probable polycomb group RING finger protein 2 at C-terminar half [Coccomyxa sp. Obi]|nr:probable polycomb group RING finger protein 2 at C-terminar half [Coccomyxa sp. Obi]
MDPNAGKNHAQKQKQAETTSEAEDQQNATEADGAAQRGLQSAASLEDAAAMESPGRASEATQSGMAAGTSGNGNVHQEDARPDVGHATKRPLDGDNPHAQPGIKRPRNHAGQTEARTPGDRIENGKEVDQSESKVGVSAASNGQSGQVGKGADVQRTPEVSRIDGRGSEEGAQEAVAGGVVQRSVQEVAECLACDLCYSIFRDPITAPECMHSFCRQCIEAELVGSAGGNICPACAREGERTLLGANPFAYHRLQPDFVLEALVRKIFPETIRVEYEKRRPQYVPQRLGQSLMEPVSRPSRARGQQMPPADVVPLFLHRKGGEDEGADGKRLEMPYVRVPKALPVAVLAKYVAQRLSQARARVQLFYKDRELQQGQTVQEAADMCKALDGKRSTLLELSYVVVQAAPEPSNTMENGDVVEDADEQTQ